MDLYRILNVSRNASIAEIKHAYRKLALKHHPDLHPPGTARQEAEAIFKKVSQAYQVLSNSKQRLEYDSSSGFSGTSRYGNSSMRHANWNPRPTSKSNTDTTHSTRDHKPFDVNDHFNIPVWNAAHYGDEMNTFENIRCSNSWMNDAGPHQRYYQRKREYKERKAREKKEEMNTKPKSDEEDARFNLNKKRDERRQSSKDELRTKVDTESQSGCVVT